MARTWEVVVRGNVPARMRDGTNLMSNVYRPAGGGPYPVLLARLQGAEQIDWSRAVVDSSSVRALKGGPRPDRIRPTEVGLAASITF